MRTLYNGIVEWVFHWLHCMYLALFIITRVAIVHNVGFRGTKLCVVLTLLWVNLDQMFWGTVTIKYITNITGFSREIIFINAE